MFSDMNKIKRIWKTTIATATGLLIPAFALAQNATLPQGINLPLIGGGTVKGFIVTLINLVLVVVGLIAIVFLIWGGFRYITSAGNEESAEKAKKTIQNAIIGLVVVILSYTVIIAISNFLGGAP
jgi:cytochrome bd-type quinol oxidase subunit 2